MISVRGVAVIEILDRLPFVSIRRITTFAPPICSEHDWPGASQSMTSERSPPIGIWFSGVCLISFIFGHLKQTVSCIVRATRGVCGVDAPGRNHGKSTADHQRKSPIAKTSLTGPTTVLKGPTKQVTRLVRKFGRIALVLTWPGSWSPSSRT